MNHNMKGLNKFSVILLLIQQPDKLNPDKSYEKRSLNVEMSHSAHAFERWRTEGQLPDHSNNLMT